MTAKPRLSTARGREIGQLLREARQSTDLSTIDMGKALGIPQPNVCRLESGDRGTSDEQLMFYIGYCRASKAMQQQMRALLKERDHSYLVRPHQPHICESLRSLILHESMTTNLISYESFVVPGLLQDFDYSLALMHQSVGGQLEQLKPWADLRTARQKILSEVDPPETTFYIHEAALQAKVGSNRVMRDQMLKLALMCGWHDVTIRLVPFSAGNRSMLRGQFCLMDLPKAPSIVYLEGEVVSLIVEKSETVKAYQDMQEKLAGLALDQEESRSVFAQWADRYDRLREDPDEGGVA